MRSYRIILSIIVICGLSLSEANAQRRIEYSQFYQTASLYNPAFTGVEDFIDVKVGYRNRWAGTDNSPTSAFALGNFALKTSTGNRYKRRGVRLVEPEAYHQLETAEEFQYRKGRRHGIGIAALSDNNDAFSSIGGQFNYAYHLAISDFLIWNLGTSVTILNETLDGTNLTVLNPDNDPTYQALLNGKQSNTNMYLNVGTVLYNFRFYLGYSANNLVRNTLSDTETFSQTKNEIVHNLIAGWRMFPRYGVEVSPALMTEFVAGRGVDVILAIRGKYLDKFWGGISYRYNDAVGANLGLHLTENIAFSYNFEYALSATNAGNFGNHELILALKLKNKNYSRAYMW